MSDAAAPTPEVTIDDLEDHIAEGGLVYDVREVDEYNAGHVPGAVLLPLSELQARWQEVPSDKGTVHVICHVGGRSMQAATALRQAGIDAVTVYGGTAAWIESGRELES
jgi:rhodanese-related sulfurtransferase